MNKSELDRYRSQGASALVDAYQRLVSERDALVKSAFIAGVEWCNECHFNGSFSCEVYAANQYANQLRAEARE